MKTRVAIFLLLVISMNILLVNNLFAQKDSVNITYSNEDLSKSDLNYKRKYRYLDINMRKETTLFKLGITPTFSTTGYGLDISIFQLAGQFSVEQKISPSFSLSLINYNYYSHYEPGLTIFGSSLNLQNKYYYNMKRNIENSISENNFNSNYLSFQLNNVPIYRYYENDFPVYSGGAIINKETKFELDFNVGWGIQRRIDKWGYMDAKVKLGYSDATARIYVGFDMSFGLGFGFSKKQ